MKTLKIVSLVGAIAASIIVGLNILIGGMDSTSFIGCIMFLLFIWYSVSVYSFIKKLEEDKK